MQEYLDRPQLNSEKTTDSLDSVNSSYPVEDIDIDEKVLQRRSLRMHNPQRSWQVWFFLFTFLNFVVGYFNLYYMLEMTSVFFFLPKTKHFNINP